MLGDERGHWENESPQEPGWYSAKRSLSDCPEMVKVFGDKATTVLRGSGRYACCTFSVSDFALWWSEPGVQVLV